MQRLLIKLYPVLQFEHTRLVSLVYSMQFLMDIWHYPLLR